MMKYVKAASDSDSAILHDVHNSFLNSSNAFFSLRCFSLHDAFSVADQRHLL